MAMRLTELVRMDSKGRIIVPMTYRNSFDLREGMYLMLIADTEAHEIKIIPFADPSAKLVEIHVQLDDVPGALAKVATILAEKNVDLLSTQSRTLHRGQTAEWNTIADVSKCKLKLSELKDTILAHGAAKAVKIRPYE